MDSSRFPAYALAGACALLALAAVFAWVHWRHRDAGARWFFVAYLLSGVFFVFDAQLRPTGPTSNPMTVVLATLTFMSLAFGLFEYQGMPRRAQLRWTGLVIAAPLAVAVTQLFMPVLRTVSIGALSTTMLVMAVSSWRASRREPCMGHAIVAAVLVLYPLAYGVCLAAGGGIDAFRYAAILPLGITGLTLIAISLSRARWRLQRELELRQQAEGALRTLNQQLEHRVEQRTAELHDVIEGLESFNRMVSHDLRAPLAGIAGLSELVQMAYDEGRPERARELLALMGTQTRRLADLVHDLLLLGRLSENRLERRHAPLDEPLREALQTLALSSGGERVSRVAATPLPAASFDPSLMRQVFVNLIGNALKFTRDIDEPRIEVAAAREGPEIVLSVRDNGAGFDMARADELFVPFKRLHSGYEGSGIGLTIVRRIVERHGGRAWAQGAMDRGATFFVSLPAAGTS
jgi:signal transduction histidine kinase